MPVANETNELSITRVYEAPIKAVWDAWTDPAQTAQWWGPRGFTLTTHGKDLRPGGHWSYTMHGPDGVDYPNKTIYHEVEPERKLVYDHGGDDDRPPMFRVTVLFTRLGAGKTRMDMTMTLPSPKAARETAKFIKSAGGDSTWDRLAEYVARKLQGKDQFVIARSFEAPAETLFDLWTDPKHIARWLPPTGVTMRLIRADVRPGGSAFYSMTDGKGLTFHGRIHYVEIHRPERIVYTQEFVDQDENISRHPLAPTWPASMLTVVRLDAETPTRTRVSVTWEPHGATTVDEVRTFIEARAGMTQGWTGSFDKLDTLIEKTR